MPSSAPRIRPRVCGQERSQRNDCPLQGKLQGREFLWSSPFLPFYFSDSSLRKTICLSAMSGVSPIVLCSPPAANNLPRAAALFRPGALSSLKAGRIINGISLQQISHSVYTAGPGAGLSYISRNSQDSNVFPSGRVLMLCILFLWLSIHDSL